MTEAEREQERIRVEVVVRLPKNPDRVKRNKGVSYEWSTIKGRIYKENN